MSSSDGIDRAFRGFLRRWDRWRPGDKGQAAILELWRSVYYHLEWDAEPECLPEEIRHMWGEEE